jgi:hypothetical protein
LRRAVAVITAARACTSYNASERRQTAKLSSHLVFGGSLAAYEDARRAALARAWSAISAAAVAAADAADAAAIALCHCSIAPFIASRDAAIARSIR